MNALRPHSSLEQDDPSWGDVVWSVASHLIDALLELDTTDVYRRGLELLVEALPDDNDYGAWEAEHTWAMVTSSAGVLPQEPSAVTTPGAGDPGYAARPQSYKLVTIAESEYRLGRTPEGETFAVPLVGPATVKLLRGSDSLRAELARRFYVLEDRVPSQTALADAMTVLTGRALQFPPEQLHLRVAEDAAGLWLDLGDDSGRVVLVGPQGWSVLESAPMLFRRTALTSALPEPVRGGHLDELWALVNVNPDDRPVVLAVLVAQLDPGIAHPAVLVTGQQGSGKSTAMRTLAGLLDPSPVPLRKPPKDLESWTVTAAGSWSIAVDNVSTIPAWWSDSLCRAVTGDGDVRRKLYSDGDLSVFAFRRCLWLNGIDLTADRGDLAERAVIARFDRLSGRRRDERDLAAAWSVAHPRVLAALLDLAVLVLAARSSSAALVRDFRMIDFARILAAVDAVLGTTTGLDRYAHQTHDLALAAVSGDPVLAAITEKIRLPWTGTAADLLALLLVGTFHGDRAREWPTTARQLTSHLHRTAPQLREVGWTVQDVSRWGPTKAIGWTLEPPTRTTTDSR